MSGNGLVLNGSAELRHNGQHEIGGLKSKVNIIRQQFPFLSKKDCSFILHNFDNDVTASIHCIAEGGHEAVLSDWSTQSRKSKSWGSGRKKKSQKKKERSESTDELPEVLADANGLQHAAYSEIDMKASIDSPATSDSGILLTGSASSSRKSSVSLFGPENYADNAPTQAADKKEMAAEPITDMAKPTDVPPISCKLDLNNNNNNNNEANINDRDITKECSTNSIVRGNNGNNNNIVNKNRNINNKKSHGRKNENKEHTTLSTLCTDVDDKEIKDHVKLNTLCTDDKERDAVCVHDSTKQADNRTILNGMDCDDNNNSNNSKHYGKSKYDRNHHTTLKNRSNNARNGIVRKDSNKQRSSHGNSHRNSNNNTNAVHGTKTNNAADGNINGSKDNIQKSDSAKNVRLNSHDINATVSVDDRSRPTYDPIHTSNNHVASVDASNNNNRTENVVTRGSNKNDHATTDSITPNNSHGNKEAVTQASTSSHSSVLARQPKDLLNRSIKDLNRTAVSLARFHLVLEEELESSEKSIKEVFAGLAKCLEDRQHELMRELSVCKEKSVEMLNSRQQDAAGLKHRCARLPIMTDDELVHLRAEIKGFVGDRKIDETIAKTKRFSCDKDEATKFIKDCGRVAALVAPYNVMTDDATAPVYSQSFLDKITPQSCHNPAAELIAADAPPSDASSADTAKSMTRPDDHPRALTNEELDKHVAKCERIQETLLTQGQSIKASEGQDGKSMSTRDSWKAKRKQQRRLHRQQGDGRYPKANQSTEATGADGSQPEADPPNPPSYPDHYRATDSDVRTHGKPDIAHHHQRPFRKQPMPYNNNNNNNNRGYHGDKQRSGRYFKKHYRPDYHREDAGPGPRRVDKETREAVQSS